MRIIIETEAAGRPDVSFHVQAEPAAERARKIDESALEAASDGGQPAQELLSALGAVDASGDTARTDRARDGARRAGEDAGSAPPWLVAVIEGGESGRRTS
jgi:hypothetical protein